MNPSKLETKIAGDEKLLISIELAKSGFENAQGRIGLIDTKVSVAVGLLIVLLPAPLGLINWLTGLQLEISKVIFSTCLKNQILTILIVAGVLGGMSCAFTALLKGISCLSPRGPKGYGKVIPFQKEWQPNILFPIHKPEKYKVFFDHLQKLRVGVSLSFVVDEYDHQLQQLGSILHAKFNLMSKCFWWLNLCLVCYGVAILSAACMALLIFLRGSRP
jgi:hypothetical protein